MQFALHNKAVPSNSKPVAEDSEIWAPIYSGKYEVSSLGRVRFGTTKRILSQSLHPKGYKRTSIKVNGKCYCMGTHILIMLGFVGERPPGMEINHRDFDKTNNRPSNLEYIPQRHNAEHYWHSEVTAAYLGVGAERAAEVQHLHATGHSINRLSHEMNIPRYLVRYLVKGHEWKHMPDPLPLPKSLQVIDWYGS